MSGVRWSRLEATAGALAWCMLVLSLTVVVLASSTVTSGLVRRLDVAAETELTQDEALLAAESVRAFVWSSRSKSLPSAIGDRPAFDDAATSHLLDVRAALAATRAVAGATALLLAVWTGLCVARSRWDAMAHTIVAGGWTTLAIVAVMALFSLAGFERAFAAFHGLLFTEGTWLFPADALLIQLFPERYWVQISALGALLAAFGGVALVVVGRRLRGRVGG